MTKEQLQDYCDVHQSVLSNAGPDDTEAAIRPAIGQMLRGWQVEGDWLTVKSETLESRSFGVDQSTRKPLRLCPHSKSELSGFLGQHLVEGSTAILVGKKHVLTTAHWVVREAIYEHVFVFGRTVHDPDIRYEEGMCRIPRKRVHKAKTLIAWVYGVDNVADWAVLELWDEVKDVEPLRTGAYSARDAAVVLGHPLGLPLKRATADPIDHDPARPPNYALLVDNGLGGSGSAVVQGNKLVGVVRGDVAAVDQWVSRVHRHGPCLDFANPNCENAQPFTPAQMFAPTLPEIFGR